MCGSPLNFCQIFFYFEVSFNTLFFPKHANTHTQPSILQLTWYTRCSPSLSQQHRSSVWDSCLSSHSTGWLTVCMCVFQGHRHLWYRFWRCVPDGCGGSFVPVRVHVYEKRARRTGWCVQHLLHQHCKPRLSRLVYRGHRNIQVIKAI